MFPTIMIVDDEPSILKSLSGLLLDEDFEIITASNGYEALKIIDEESPDLVLLDIWMPGIDGIETLKEIKKMSPNLPVVMITGHGSIESAVEATKSGAFDFLEKPLSIDKVMVTINNALNFRKLEEENIYLRKKSIEKNSITGTSPADDADFFARTHLKAELSEHNLSIWSISELDLLKLNSTLECIHSFLLTSDALISLLRGSLQIEDFLDAHHHALKFIIVTKQAPQPGHLKAVDGCNHE